MHQKQHDTTPGLRDRQAGKPGVRWPYEAVFDGPGAGELSAPPDPHPWLAYHLDPFAYLLPPQRKHDSWLTDDLWHGICEPLIAGLRNAVDLDMELGNPVKGFNAEFERSSDDEYKLRPGTRLERISNDEFNCLKHLAEQLSDEAWKKRIAVPARHVVPQLLGELLLGRERIEVAPILCDMVGYHLPQTACDVVAPQAREVCLAIPELYEGNVATNPACELRRICDEDSHFKHASERDRVRHVSICDELSSTIWSHVAAHPCAIVLGTLLMEDDFGRAHAVMLREHMLLVIQGALAHQRDLDDPYEREVFTNWVCKVLDLMPSEAYAEDFADLEEYVTAAEEAISNGNLWDLI